MSSDEAQGVNDCPDLDEIWTRDGEMSSALDLPIPMIISVSGPSAEVPAWTFPARARPSRYLAREVHRQRRRYRRSAWVDRLRARGIAGVHPQQQREPSPATGNLESTDRSLTTRGAGLPESSAGVPAFAGRRRGRAGARSRRSAPLGGAEGAGARVREACAGMLARASDPGRRCERASGRERYRP